MPDNEFYHTYRWHMLRDKILRRDKFLCVECVRYGKHTQATTVHHVKERDDYPELRYDASNLESLCAACHNKKHPEKGKNQEKSHGY